MTMENAPVMEIIQEPDWDKIVAVLKKERGTALVLGKSDSGKSTFIRHLIGRLVSAKFPVALVDADIGQSSLGLPGTVSMKIFRAKSDLNDYRPGKIFFVGGLNPAYRIPLVVYGTKKMAGYARRRGIGTIVVDTGGLVQGQIGKALKSAKIKAVRPSCIIAIQEKDELEHILDGMENVFRLRRSPSVKGRSRIARTKYREKRFLEYFRNTITADLPLREIYISDLHSEKSEEPPQPGTVMGLNHSDDTVALGLLTGFTEEGIALRTPLKNLTRINRLVFGDITLPDLL